MGAYSVDPLEVTEFGEDDGHEAGFLQQFETEGGGRGEDDFVEFGGDALGGDDMDAFGVAGDGVEGFGEDTELQLSGESDGAHHAEGVVAESDVGVEGCADETLVEVVDAAEGVEQLAESVAVEGYGHCVDGEVAAVLVVLQGAVFHDGLAAVAAVALAAGADKFYLPQGVALAINEGCGAEVFEYRDVDVGIDGTGSGLGKFDAVAEADDVDVGAGTVEEVIAYHAAHGIGLHTEGVGSGAYNAVDGVVEDEVHGSRRGWRWVVAKLSCGGGRVLFAVGAFGGVVDGVVEVSFFVVEFPDAYTLTFAVSALIVGHAVFAVDGVRSIFKAVGEVGFHLWIAVGEIEDDAAAAHAVGEALGAADGVVAVELDDVLVLAGTENHSAGSAEGAEVGDIYRVEFAVVVGTTVAVVERPVGAEIVSAAEVAAGKELAVVEEVLPDAIGYFGLAAEFLLELELATFVIHALAHAGGRLLVALYQKDEHGFAIGIALYHLFADVVARGDQGQCCDEDECCRDGY